MITSERTFGVELEMGLNFNDSSKIKAALNKLQQKADELNWNITDDASLRNFSYALEARSPILKGKEGEKNFREFCNYAHAIGFTTNPTCGTHIHLGGEDFSKRENLKEVSLAEFVKHRFKLGYNQGIAFDVSAYELLLRSQDSIFNEYVVQANNDEDFMIKCPLPNGLYSTLVRTKMYVPEIGENINLVIKRSKLNRILENNNGEEVEKDYLVLGEDIDIKDIVFLSRPIKDNVNKLRNLFLFYTSFDSVLFAMLPRTRREPNKYCKPLSYSYSIPQISEIRTMGHLEKLWYQKQTTTDLVRSKRDYKHPSRRHSVNLHSLLGGIGTVEVRLHDGSLDTEEIVKWVELHQYILDTISDDNFDLEVCQMGARSNDLHTKIEAMFRTINMPENLVDYVLQQIDKNK